MIHFTDEAWAHMTHEGHPRARLARLMPETLARYRAAADADQMAMAHHSTYDPDIRERLQLALMRGTSVPGLARVAAQDRYYEATHGGDWAEDH